jgi:S1-C subfamily serine protease
MAAQWFYQIMGEQFGPVEPEELRRLAAGGVIGPGTLVRQGGDGQWILAEYLRGLFAQSAAAVQSPGSWREVKSTLSPPPLALPQGPKVPLAQPAGAGSVPAARPPAVAADERERIHPLTWAAVIAGAGTVLLLLWALVFRGQGGSREEAKQDGPAAESRSESDKRPQVRESAPVAEGKTDANNRPKVRENAPREPLTDSAVYEQTVGSVVIVRSFHGVTPIAQGSGFLLYPGDRIVTNEHVIRGSSMVKIEMKGGESLVVTSVLVVDEDRDIAVLSAKETDWDAVLTKALGPAPAAAAPAVIPGWEVVGPAPAAPPKTVKIKGGLTLAKAPPKIGDAAFALGAPQGLDFTFTKGIVSQLRRDFGPYGSVVQTDVSVSPGSSGGPLVDRYGQVVGINTLGSRAVAEAHNLNFAVSAEEIAAVCKRQSPCDLSKLPSYASYMPPKALADAERQEREADAARAKKGEEEARRAEEKRQQEFEKRREEERTAKAALTKKWRQVRKGLSRKEVRDLLGEPMRIEGGGILETWNYPGRGSVTFHEETYISGYDRHLGSVHSSRWVVFAWREPGSSY